MLVGDITVSNYMVLVAEDESDVRKLLVDAFELSGFDAVGVEDGAEAVAEATKMIPDLILLDVRMPNMTGFEACKILKAQESTRQIPVVFLSAYGQEAEVKTGLQLGAEDYLLKPFAIHELVYRIKKILNQYGKS
jgi:two-component system alkaline phosphatase synthesis response regulator PhoP